eukprot:m.15588 g.15588  ORF g.15588 m.15588 type:complete len:606 (+) comp5439_c0_seq2:157-1974(+)
MTMAKSYTRHATFPPQELVDDESEEGRNKLCQWYKDRPYEPTAQELSPRAKELLLFSASDYIAARRAGTVTCREYAEVLVSRMLHLKDTQQFTLASYRMTDVIINAAKQMDEKAAKEGVESIAPLYGLPVPAKGTMATTDFPSCAGHAALHDVHALKDAAILTLFRDANAIVMGKTNVPEFAASWTTMNPLNGRTMNMYRGDLTSGGSSGGSGSAVSAHVAPVALTEDTGGSTRHPAFQNNNFGYDPSRNHYPNEGNPGITYTNDQVGLNARSFDDILLIDSLILNTREEHATALAAASACNNSEIRIGTPLFPFVELTLRDDVYNFWGVKSCAVSDELRAKYDTTKEILSSAGFTIVEKEWPDVPSEHFKEPVNGAMETLFGNRRINNKDYDGIGAAHFHSFSGQLSEYVLSYLNSDISLKEIRDGMLDGGDGHSPTGFLKFSSFTDESQHRATGIVQTEKLQIWNNYFETHNVDVIMVPPQYSNAIKYSEMSNKSIPVAIRQQDGSYKMEPSSIVQSNLVPYFAFKDIPVPKVVVPTGLDDEGRPTAVEFLGKGPPLSKLFDSDFAKTHDLEFLYKVQRLVSAMHKEPSLQRVEPPTVAKELC